ncbi:MAG: hypothetical protein AWU54_2147 [Candidatus Frackibacter sp. T328-2]|jgi:hypothetical protein|nr:MAG: hypothetical protein AWU54_2147 [Candidatus Frackibacter sp. T328-2]
MSSTYEIIQKQRKERNLLQREKEAEERYLPVLEMTLRDTCRTKIGRQNYRSIASQLNSWIKSLSKEQKRNKLFFVELDTAIEEFKSHVLEKYKSNKSQRNKFESLFSQEGYIKDCRRILAHKIYDYKTDQSLNNPDNGFLSATAYRVAMTNHLERELRKLAHEGMASTIKKLNAPRLPDDIEKMVIDNFKRLFVNYLDEFMSVQKQNLLSDSDRPDLLN